MKKEQFITEYSDGFASFKRSYAEKIQLLIESGVDLDGIFADDEALAASIAETLYDRYSDYIESYDFEDRFDDRIERDAKCLYEAAIDKLDEIISNSPLIMFTE